MYEKHYVLQIIKFNLLLQPQSHWLIPNLADAFVVIAVS